MPPDRADKPGADDERGGSINQDGHHCLREAARYAWTDAWTLGRERRVDE